MAPLKRSENIRMLLSTEEKQMLQELADADGLTSSDVVRQFIRREYSARFGDRPVAKPKKKKP